MGEKLNRRERTKCITKIFGDIFNRSITLIKLAFVLYILNSRFSNFYKLILDYQLCVFSNDLLPIEL